MVRKKLDERIRILLERCVSTGQRSMLVLVGDRGKDQVPNLHQLLSRTSVRARPSVLWCYKKELGFSTHRKKRMKKIKRDKARGLSKGDHSTDSTNADAFELFVSSTSINWCYYRDTHRILGTTCGVLVLQDFEALTPNLLARTVETVEGGGLIVFLMRTATSLRQLCAMAMDVHARYRTEGSGEVVPRFNERFLLSLGRCRNCLVCDDELNVLPLSRSTLRRLGKPVSSSDGEGEGSAVAKRGEGGEILTRRTPEDDALADLQSSLRDAPHVGCIVELTKTLDQAKAVLVFLDAVGDKNHRNGTTVALTAPRGRGKSASVGLCLAGALSFGYSTIVVTAPEPENLGSVFEFLIRGLVASKYKEHLDYDVTYDADRVGRDATKCVVRVDVHRDHRQSVRYVRPHETEKFATAELVAIDEAAAIPLPIVKKLMGKGEGGGDRLTFLSSTVNGYEGTGRSLSLKLVKELRDRQGGRGRREAADAAATTIAGSGSNKGEAKVHERRWAAAAAAAGGGGETSATGSLREIELSTPIRYARGDPIEAWLDKLLCLDSASDEASTKLRHGAPSPSDCRLYRVDRDALFSYHRLSESFLQKIMGLYTSAHYKNSPNDLQMLGDAPAHSVFVLLGPNAEEEEEGEEGGDGSSSLPDVLAVVQVALEGRISRKAVEAQLARGRRSAGDLIPWTISQQFGDSNFASLSGARIVRVAVHPAVQGMGYGSCAVESLYRYYNGDAAPLSGGGRGDEEDDDGDETPEESEASESGDDSDSNGEGGGRTGGEGGAGRGIRGETLRPRKRLPPLLLPIDELDAPPRLDWIGSSFGLTAPLHRFWRKAGMKTLYVRQTPNDLTGEHSTIMVRSLPRRTGYDDAWLPAFAVDARRRTIHLLSGPFRGMDVRLAVSILDEDGIGSPSSGSSEETLAAIAERSGLRGSSSSSSSSPTAGGVGNGRIGPSELDTIVTPHDLKRLELYGRNLCDHHLVTDLLPTIARLYFNGRFGHDFSLSSLQGALLCGVGLQHKTIDVLSIELDLPSNQTLAMFNKSVRKMSAALREIAEEGARESMLGGRRREEAERTAEKMKDVSRRTLEEDAMEGAKNAAEALKRQTASSILPPEISNDPEIMQYAVKGTDEDWSNALRNKDVEGDAAMATVRIGGDNGGESAGKAVVKRKLNEEDVRREATGGGGGKGGQKTPDDRRGKGSGRKSKKKKSSKKARR